MSGNEIVTNNGTEESELEPLNIPLPSQGVDGASTAELELALQTFQQTAFAQWHAKILAGQFQRRLDHSIKMAEEHPQKEA